jgi:hypothetical protein
MVVGELVGLPQADLKRLRIITRSPNQSVTSSIKEQLIPYDDRLDGPDSSRRGTLADFASRAAHHFAREVVANDPDGSAEAHRAAVQFALAPWRPPVSVERARHDDETLVEIIRAHWDRANGQSTRLLRILRDELNIACEQGRFVMLMNKLRHERQLVA